MSEMPVNDLPNPPEPVFFAEAGPPVDSTPSLHDALMVSREEIEGMDSADYLKYLVTLTHSEADEAEMLLHLPDKMDIIVRRFEADAVALKQASGSDRFAYHSNLELAHDIGETTDFLLFRLAFIPEFSLSPQHIEQMYGYLDSPVNIVRHTAVNTLDKLIVFDSRNQAHDTSLGLFERFQADCIRHMLSDTPVDAELAFDMLEKAWADYGPKFLEVMFQSAVAGVETPAQAANVFRLFSNRLKEGGKTALKILFDPKQLSPFCTKALQMLTMLGLVPDTGVTADSSQLYDRFDIGQWKPNEELLQFETDLLTQQFQGAHRVVDIGFGAARHMEALARAKIPVFGLDLSTKNMAYARNLRLTGQVVQASWDSIPFAPGQFDKAYCLGRSYPHNFTHTEMAEFFMEANRVLTADGELIIDLPDPKLGNVSQQIGEFDTRSQALGIDFIEPGTHIGTPDKENFTLRFVPTDEQLENIALLQGFKAEKIAQKDYQDHTGKTNTNYYWKFTKFDRTALSLDELMDAMHKAHTSEPALYLSWASL